MVFQIKHHRLTEIVRFYVLNGRCHCFKLNNAMELKNVRF